MITLRYFKIGTLFIAFLMLNIATFAQKNRVLNFSEYDSKKFHWGFSMGLNMADFNLHFWNAIGDNPQYTYDPTWATDQHQVNSTDTIRADIASLNIGFTASIITDLRLGRYFNLRFLPGLSFGERRLKYNVNDQHLPVLNVETGGEDQEYVLIKSTYINLPLHIKYKSSRLNNHRAYLIGGFAYKVDVSRTGSKDLINLNGGSMFLDLGVGLDSYLPFFKLGTELKFSLGLEDLIAQPSAGQRAYYAQSIKRISSNIVTLSFHFE